MVDGNVHGTVLVSGNETVMLPKDPEKAGYTFVGWFLDNDTFEKPFKATQFVTTAISADTKVYAKFIKDNTGEHTCSYASEWSKNETSHWRLCECGEKGYLGDHVFDEGTVRVNPTCTDEGEKIYFCETCGYTKTEKISTIPHVYYDAWNSNSTNHWKLCKCGDKGYNTPHDFDKGEIIIEATCTREGQIKYVCDTCGYEKTEIIKKEDHKYSTEYTMNAEYHFYECSCGAKQGEEKHTPSAPATIDKDQVCTKCGYVLAKYAGITFNTLSQSGTNLSGKVRNSVTSFDFNAEITVHGNATFVVSRDKYGETPISTKVVTLNAGNNVFYVQEIIGGEVEETYTVTLRRRPTYTVTFVTLGSNVPAQTVEEDFLATKPTQNPVRVGYTFAGWDYDFNSAVTSAITVNAKWTPNENTAYKVEHWFENANDSGYTKDASKTETKYATTGTNVVAISKNFEHFHFNADKSEVIGTVAPDGSLVIILYYDREKINVVFNANGGTIVGENKEIVSKYVKYGGTITAPNAEKVGYEFSAWDKSLTNVTETFVTNAKWTAKTYTITYTNLMSVHNPNPDTYTIEDVITLKDPEVQKPFKFTGWTLNGNPITEIKNMHGDLVIKAEIVSTNTVKVGFSESGYGGATIRELVDKFNAQNSEYYIDLTVAPAGEFMATSENDLNANTPKFDLYFMTEIYWKHLALKGYLEDLQEVYDAPFNSNMTISEAMLDDARENNYTLGKDNKKHFYSISYTQSASSLIVNMDVANFYESLSAWGSTKKIAQVKTVDELNAWVNKIESLSKNTPYTYLDGSGSGAVKGWVYPGQYMVYWDSFIDTWWAQVEGIHAYRSFFEMAESAVYNQTGRLKALEAFESLNLAEHSLDCSADDHIKAQQKFLAGRAALIPNGSWISYESKGAIAQYGANIKMIYLPKATSTCNDNYIASAPGGFTCIPTKSSDTAKAGAKEFLKFYFREENYPTMFTKETGMLTPFDGYEGDKTYVDNVWGDLNTFSRECINLINNANAHVVAKPNNFDAPNYLMLSSGVTNPWCAGKNYFGLIGKEDSVTAQTVFNDNLRQAQNEWGIWEQKIS